MAPYRPYFDHKWLEVVDVIAEFKKKHCTGWAMTTTTVSQFSVCKNSVLRQSQQPQQTVTAATVGKGWTPGKDQESHHAQNAVSTASVAAPPGRPSGGGRQSQQPQ